MTQLSNGLPSRQQLALCLLLLTLLSLAGCGVANSLRLRFANDSITPQWPGGMQQQQLALQYLGEKPYVSVEVIAPGGQRARLLMLVDTGAGISMLFDSAAVRQLHLPQGYALPLAGWGDEMASQGHQTRLQQLLLGAVRFSDVSVALLPIAQSRYFLRRDELDFDGVLGHDLLRHFSWTFAKAGRQLTLQANAYTPQPGDIALPLSEQFRKISVPATIRFNAQQQVSQPLLVDTGSRHYLKLNTAYIAEQNIRLPAAQVTAADFGLSGRTVHQRVNVEQLQLGSLVLGPVKTNLIPSDDADDWWVLGSALLNQFVVTVDYHAMQLYLRPDPSRPFRTLYNLPGVELRKLTSGNFVVRYLFANLPAAGSGLVEGDVVVSINQQPASHVSEAAWLELANQPGRMTLCRQSDCVELNNQPIAGYSAPAY